MESFSNTKEPTNIMMSLCSANNLCAKRYAEQHLGDLYRHFVRSKYAPIHTTTRNAGATQTECHHYCYYCVVINKLI